MKPTFNLYEALGVERSATKAEIKSAFRSLSKQYHPDVNQGDEEKTEKFRRISFAWEILGDDGRRKQYDLNGTAETEQTEFRRRLGILESLFKKIVSSGQATSPHFDIIDMMDKAMAGIIQKHEQMQSELSESIAEWEKVKKRLIHKPDSDQPPFLHHIAEANISGLQGRLENTISEKTDIEAAREILKGTYTCKVEKEERDHFIDAYCHQAAGMRSRLFSGFLKPKGF